jgi:Transposase, Mutator family
VSSVLLVQFESIELPTCALAPAGGVMQWALGTLASGEAEVLGLWVRERVDWELVLEELQARGVEQIRIVASTEPAFASGGPLCASAVLLRPQGQVRTLAGRSSRTRRVLRAAGGSGQGLRQRLSRYVARLGGAIERQTALLYFARTLRRWERDQQALREPASREAPRAFGLARRAVA